MSISRPILANPPSHLPTGTPTSFTVNNLTWGGVITIALLDIWLTYLGLQAGLVELNPIAHAAISLFGYGAMFPLKSAALLIGVVCWRALEQNQYLVPLTFLTLWGTAVVINTGLILLAT